MNTKTALDLIFRNARTRTSPTPVDIGVSGGRIVATLAKILAGDSSAKRGLISVCAAGGLGVTAILERA